MTRINHSFSIAVCDDDSHDVCHIEENVHKILQDENITHNIFSCTDCQALFDEMKSGRNFDLLLLDVIMPQKNGIEIAAYLRESLYKNPIIFISSNIEMALRGYEVSAARYLTKPIDTDRLREALLFCLKSKRAKSIILPVKKGVEKISVDEIKYIETRGRGCRIILENNEIFTPLLISKFEADYSDDEFIRCHQSFMVNVRFMRGIEGSELVLAGGERIPISKHRVKQIRQKFLEYLLN